MHAIALRFHLRLPQARSLKDRRRCVRPIVDGLRHRHSVSVAEVGPTDTHHFADIGVALVSESAGHLDQVAAEIERFVWSRPDIEVVDVERSWLEPEPA